MTRGRPINRSLPITPSLAAQRDYRARKAARQRDLEAEVSRLQAENVVLRAEIAHLKSQADPEVLAAPQLAHVASARAQLASAMQQLDTAINIVSALPARPLPAAASSARPHLSRAREAAPPGVDGGQSGAYDLIPASCASQGGMYGPTTTSRGGSHGPAYDPISPSRAASHAQAWDPTPMSQTRLPPFPNPAPSPSPGEHPLSARPFNPICCDGVMDCSGLLPVPSSSPCLTDDDPGPGGKPIVPSHHHASPPIPESDDCCLGLVECDLRDAYDRAR